MSMRDYLLEATKDFSIRLTETQLSQLERYHELLAEWNEKINLTAITDDMGVAVKHFADSMTVFHYIDIPQGAKIIDVGTGAGFPGLVLKIVRPDIQLTLLDSLQKRLNFLGIVLKELSLDAELIHARAEEGGQNDSACLTSDSRDSSLPSRATPTARCRHPKKPSAFSVARSHRYTALISLLTAARECWSRSKKSSRLPPNIRDLTEKSKRSRFDAFRRIV